MKPKIRNTKYEILSFRKLVPGLVLLSFVLSGILAPVSFSDKSYRSVEIKTVSAQETSANLDPNQIAGEQKQAPAAPDPTGGTKTLKGSAQAYTQSKGKTAAPPQKEVSNSPFDCNILTEFAQCVGTTIYHLIFVPAAYVLTLSGWLFDITIAFTLSKNILDINFAKDGWVVTRDLANMFFIFILLYIAIATILDIAGYNAKALLARLVIVALLLNFSLFATRVVIDASNILALAFYNSITAPVRAGDIGEVSSLVKFFDIKPKGISSGLVSFFDPQKLLGSDQVGAKKIADFAKNSTGKLIFIYMFSAVIILVTAWAFFSVAFLFITRTAVLWFLMATAPIAFAAIILPKTRSLFGKWMDELVSKSFCVAIFLFFLWLITKFTERGIFQSLSDPGGKGLVGGLGDSSDNALLFTMIIILLQFSILLVLILVAKQQTQKMCGAVAGFSMNFVSGLGTKAAGFLAGGVGGRLLRGTLGGAAFDLAESRKEKWGSGNVLQRLALQGARKVSGASFDVRGTKLGGTAELGKAGGKGGYKGAIDKRVREDVAWAKSFGEGKEADAAREKFVQRIEGQNPLSRMITGRGLLSKTEPEKAAKAIKKTLYAAEKAREEDVELREMKNKVLEEQPAEVKDEKGNIVYAYKNMNDIEAAVKSNALSILDSEKIVKEATDALVKDLSEKLEEAKADLKGFEVAKNAEGAVRTTKVVETLTKKLGSIEKMTKLEDRVENRNRRMVEKREREDAQKTSSDGGGKDKK